MLYFFIRQEQQLTHNKEGLMRCLETIVRDNLEVRARWLMEQFSARSVVLQEFGNFDGAREARANAAKMQTFLADRNNPWPDGIARC